MQLFALANLFLAGSVLATPTTLSRRSPSLRHVVRSDDEVAVANDTNVTYSSGWAGAVANGTGVNFVTATWKVPILTSPELDFGEGSSWVGIDGNTCKNSILQVGFDWSKSGGVVRYYSWYEWYPDITRRFSNFPLSGGDVITATITASSPNAGTATLENLTQGKTVSQTFSNMTGESTLCQSNAEWIIEKVGVPTSFIDFDTLTFMNASATDANGNVALDDARIFNIKQFDNVLTDCSHSGSCELTCKWLHT
ncbi:protease acp1 [Rhexocercosporidium sp. MPI-PUGE-AT-0058]|nr:protease acp1 [Rhexocercosporidium sp. MPI-PUGE-AT-0058]